MEEVDPDSEEVRELIEEINGTVIEVIEQINVLRIGIAEGAEQEALNTLQSSDLVRFASRNKYLVPTSVEVSDPDFSWQTDHYQMIKLPEAWSASMGSGEVIVAIIDSGIELSHPDLQDNIWTGDDICDDGSDDDLNGFIDDCNGWNFAQSNNDTQDEGGSWPRCNGHGTHVAGIVGASNNQEGGIGVAPHVTLMPVKVSSNLDIDGDIVCASTEAIVAQAIIYAADNGASVINASLGCPNGEKCDMPSVGDAFLYATQKGSVAVVAAGNERETSEGIDDWQDYADYIIEVSSVDLSEEIAGYSNSGPGIKISAPGTTVYSTKIEGRYGIKTGTSQAAPMVSGCAALLLSFDRSLTNVDIEQILLSSARDIGGTGWDELFGFGVLDCSNALNLVGETLPELQLPGYSGSETGDAGGEEEFDESDEEQQSTELEPQQAGISVAMKHKKKVTLAAVKNEGELPIFGIELRILDGTIKFVKSRGWDRDRIDQKTVLVNTADRPIQPGSTAIILLIVDSRISPFEWRALDEYQEAAAMGSVTPR
jgi:subtilisin family serine protease